MTKFKFFYITLIISLFIACNSDDDGNSGIPGVVSTTNISVEPTLVSFFDQAAIDYELFVSLGVVDEVEVTAGNATELVSINDKMGVFTADFTDLGVNVIGATNELSMIPFASGVALDTVSSVIEIFNPVTISAPETIVQTREVDTLFTYAISTNQNTISNILVESKVFFDGMYQEILNGITEESGTVAFNASNFTKFDTVYYKVTATTADGLVASEETTVFIDTEYFENSIEGSLTTSEQYYSFPDFESLDAEDEAVIELIVDSDNVFNSELMVIDSDSTITFVEYTDATEDTFNSGDMLEAISIYESGTPSTSVTSLEIGKTVIYKSVSEEEVVVYGIIRIDSILSTETEDTLSILIKN